MSYKNGQFVWFEHYSNDVEKAEAFYTALVGWKPQVMQMGDFAYKMLCRGEKPLLGLLAQDQLPSEAAQSSAWVPYLEVEDVDAATARCGEAGATVLREAIDLPGVGRTSLINDPEGAPVFLFKSANPAPPEEPAQHGDFHWNELWSADPQKALSFYEGQLGYSHEDMDMGPAGTYYVLTQSDGPQGGVMKSPAPEAPVAWLPYVHVDDVDATVAKAKELGGSVPSPIMDTPGVGRHTVVIDPTGASIGVITPAAKG